MPLYEYQCEACGHRFEVIQKFSDQPPDKCPKCGGAVRKLQSAPAFQFKGSGFYITDYPKKDQSGPGKDESSSKDGGGGEKKDGASDKKDAGGEKGDKSDKKDAGGEKSSAATKTEKSSEKSSSSGAGDSSSSTATTKRP